ncbi:MAG: DUF4440 domain-containing protein [Bacteroidota bacterium]|jgi:hypothetical protein|nr:DUF4440 domain-containing protein [Bacteroidota bacterium]
MKEARRILDTWVEKLRANDLDAIIAMYAPGSVLLPTFSPHRIASSASLREYFAALVARDHLTVTVHEESLRIIPIGGSAATLVGIYSFSFVVDDTTLTFPSRFTFVIDTAAQAPILHHHSSQVPRTLS